MCVPVHVHSVEYELPKEGGMCLLLRFSIGRPGYLRLQLSTTGRSRRREMRSFVIVPLKGLGLVIIAMCLVACSSGFR